MLSERTLFRILVSVLIAGIALAVTLALVAPAHGKTTVEAMSLVVPRYSPTPGSVNVHGLKARRSYHRTEFLRVAASVHTFRDRRGRLMAQACGAAAAYGRRGRPVERRIALRVVLVGDRHGYGRAFPLDTTRRQRCGKARPITITEVKQARVLAWVERGDGRWTAHLLHSEPVRIG